MVGRTTGTEVQSGNKLAKTGGSFVVLTDDTPLQRRRPNESATRSVDVVGRNNNASTEVGSGNKSVKTGGSASRSCSPKAPPTAAMNTTRIAEIACGGSDHTNCRARARVRLRPTAAASRTTKSEGEEAGRGEREGENSHANEGRRVHGVESRWGRRARWGAVEDDDEVERGEKGDGVGGGRRKRQRFAESPGWVKGGIRISNENFGTGRPIGASCTSNQSQSNVVEQWKSYFFLLQYGFFFVF